MTHAVVRFLLLVVVVSTVLVMGVPAPTALRAEAQAPERLPSFEVASVKENRSGDARAPSSPLVRARTPTAGSLSTRPD
jgi:hypothetical protein